MDGRMTHDDALPALPIGEAEVLWHKPDPVMPERPGRIIDASHAFMDAAPLGTRLYSAEQMRAYARQAVALWKLSAMAQEDERAALAARAVPAWTFDTFRAMGECPFCRYDHSVGPLCKHAVTMLSLLAAPPAPEREGDEK